MSRLIDADALIADLYDEKKHAELDEIILELF